MQTEPDYLALYSRNCLRCSYLVEGMEKRFKCHYTKGNEFCPAREVRITITGKIQQFLERLSKARAVKDAKAEALVWEEVSRESRAFQVRMYDLVNEKL